MRIARRLLPVALLGAAAAFAAEQLNVQPGYWTITTTMTTGGAPLYIQEMTAANRAEYAKSWAKDVGKPHVDTDDDCITSKDIREAKFFEDLDQQGKSCKKTLTKQTATALAGIVECSDAKTKTRTEVDFTADSPTTFKGSFKSTLTSPNGTTTMSMTMAGKLKAASCPADEDDSEED
jgi:hypothetical protein